MHPALVMDHRAGADTDHYVMSLMMGSFQKVNVVRCYDRDSEFFGNFQKRSIAEMLRLKSVIMELKVKVFPAEDVHEFAGRFLGLVQVSRLDCHIDFTFQAGAHPDQAGTVFRQQLFVDTRLIVKTLQVRGGDQFHKIAVTAKVFCQQREVEGGVSGG